MSKTSLRLLLVADSLHIGGAEQHVVSLASALVQRGYHVTIACSEKGFLAPLAERAGVVVRPLLDRLVKRRLSPQFAQELAKHLRQESYDLVHAHMYASDAACACALSGTTPPLVLTEHSEASWRSADEQRCSQWFYAKARHIIAVSKQIRKRLIEHDGVPSHRISVIMNTLLPGLEASGGVQQACPAMLAGKPLVGVVARLQPEKGIGYFIEAAAYVLRVIPHAHFLIIGDGQERHSLQEQAIALGVQEQVHFIGFRLDVRALMQGLDVVVVPSLSEGTPLVTLEAMAAGIPIVASAVGGIPEQVRHLREGLLVPPADPQALGKAMIYLLQNPARLRQLGEAGRLRVAAHFQFGTMIEQTEAVYRTVLSASPHIWEAGQASLSQMLPR